MGVLERQLCKGNIKSSRCRRVSDRCSREGHRLRSEAAQQRRLFQRRWAPSRIPRKCPRLRRYSLGMQAEAKGRRWIAHVRCFSRTRLRCLAAMTTGMRSGVEGKTQRRNQQRAKGKAESILRNCRRAFRRWTNCTRFTKSIDRRAPSSPALRMRAR